MPSLSLPQLATRIVKTLALWAARARERRDLMDLDDHLLRDIGVTREGAFAEARRPPWSGTERRHEKAPHERISGKPVSLRVVRAP